jgi:lysozyme
MAKGARTTAVAGAAVAGLLLPMLPKLEGEILRGYRDPIGIVTACSGHTKTAILGKAYTKEQCAELLDMDTAEHAQGVLACTPGLKGQPYYLAAATSFAFNFGVAAYCGSSIATEFKRQDYATACVRFNTNAAGLPQWVNVKDKRIRLADGSLGWTYKSLPGLVKRRAIERSLCEQGLTA